MNRTTCVYIFAPLLAATLLLALTACGPAPSTEEEPASLPSIPPPTDTIQPPSATTTSWCRWAVLASTSSNCCRP